MALVLSPMQGPGVGIRFGVQDALMTLAASHTGVKGRCYAVDMDTVDAYGVRYVIRDPVTADFTQASGAYLPTFFCIALEDQTTAAGNVKVRFVGTVDVVADDTDSAAKGKFLIPKNSTSTTGSALDTMVTAVGGGNRCVAVANAASTAAAMVNVDFDGIHGFGQALTNTT